MPRVKCASYENKAEESFKPPANAFKQQYASLYFTRLAKMRKLAEKQAKHNWGNGVCVCVCISVSVCHIG